MNLHDLKRYLQASIRKNGDKPLTLQHLVNIIGIMEKEEEAQEKALDDVYYQHLADECGDRD